MGITYRAQTPGELPPEAATPPGNRLPLETSCCEFCGSISPPSTVDILHALAALHRNVVHFSKESGKKEARGSLSVLAHDFVHKNEAREIPPDIRYEVPQRFQLSCAWRGHFFARKSRGFVLSLSRHHGELVDGKGLVRASLVHASITHCAVNPRGGARSMPTIFCFARKSPSVHADKFLGRYSLRKRWDFECIDSVVSEVCARERGGRRMKRGSQRSIRQLVPMDNKHVSIHLE